MVDRLFTASNNGKMLQALAFGRPPVIAFAGDSIADFAGGNKSSNSAASSSLDGASPFFWALMENYWGDCIINGSSFQNGGYNLGIGGSSSTSLLLVQIDQLKSLNPIPDIVYVQTAQNDAIATLATAQSNAANVTSFTTQALAAGVKLVILTAVPPKTGTGSTLKFKDAFNRIIEKFAQITPGVIFANYVPVWSSPAGIGNSTGIQAWRGTDGAAGGYSSDGTHPSGLACRAAASILSPILQKLMRPLSPRACLSSPYDSVNHPDGNILGLNGMFLGTGGLYNAAANANVAGTPQTGTFNNGGWTVSDNNGVIATPTIVTDSDGFNAQRLTFSGTATAAATITLRWSYFFNVTSALYAAEGLLQFNNIVGLTGFRLGGGTTNLSSNSGTSKPLPDGYSGKIYLRGRRATTFANGSGSLNFDLVFSFPSGASPTGSVDVSRCGIFRES